MRIPSELLQIPLEVLRNRDAKVLGTSLNMAGIPPEVLRIPLEVLRISPQMLGMSPEVLGISSVVVLVVVLQPSSVNFLSTVT